MNKVEPPCSNGDFLLVGFTSPYYQSHHNMEGFEVSESMVTVVADVYLRGRQMGGRRVNAPADLGKTEVERIDHVVT